MRLACPNCDARYEVPDDAIPDGGRDVQCSNCGFGWYQMPPDLEAAARAEADLHGDDLEAAISAALADTPVATAPVTVPEAMTEAVAPEAVPAPAFASDDFAEVDDDYEDEPPFAATPEPVAAAVAGRGLDESVLSVLREEAERESEARRAEAQREASRRADAEGQMQIQPDLGMATPPPPALSATQRRLAMLKGQDPDEPPPEPMRPPARRDLLPDVEEINSTLQPSEEDLDAAEREVDRLPDLTKGSSFRTGFSLAILALMLCALAYVFAPQLSSMVPALKAPLDAWVATVDGLRLWLNSIMDSATNAMSKNG